MKKNNKSLKYVEKNLKGATEDENLIRNFIILVVVIAIIIGIVYFAAEFFKKEPKYEREVTAGSINYDKLSVGMILNRPYDEYYVLVYDSTSPEAIKYSTIMSMYINAEEEDSKNHIKIYYCDLDNDLNKSYYNVGNDNESNPNAKKIEDFDFGDLTLIKIKKGKVVEYVEDYKTIQEKLK